MPAKVVFEVTAGPLQGRLFQFEERNTCIAGRKDDCNLRVPNDKDHRTISRHHCLLDINPPDVRLRDFGSLNGTYLNGKIIGKRKPAESPEEAAKFVFPEFDLKDGDEFRLGHTVFRVELIIPVYCAECQTELPEAHRHAAERAPGIYQCEVCHLRAEQEGRTEPPRKRPKVCANCGRDVSAEVGDNRQGDYVCAACQASPTTIVRHLLATAVTGETNLLGIKGYEIERELGAGGMGAVYLARRKGEMETVALKLMLPRIAVDEQAKAMFLREVENTRALRHRHLVQFRDSGFSNGVFFFTLEYCDGGSVDRLMKERGGRLPVDEAGEIILQALEGLEHAHQAVIPNIKLEGGQYGEGRGLVHRDLKPHNIFLSGTGSSRLAKIGDYGLAKAFDFAGLSGQTRSGAKMGTPSFMCRQQVKNFKYAKPEVDVWAMAASLYNMLTGYFPREFRKGVDVWQQVLDNNPVPIRDRDSSIPKRLAAVIDKAVIDKPEITFKTATELKQALERVL